MYRRRAGPLRYWLLAHVYLGVIAGIVLLLHGGRSSGGLLTSMLMVSFDLVIVSGLFGIACYIIVPRIMTSIEGDPLLFEDLTARREELRETLARIDTSDNELRRLIERQGAPASSFLCPTCCDSTCGVNRSRSYWPRRARNLKSKRPT